MFWDIQYILNVTCFHKSIKKQPYENPAYLGVSRWESQNYGTPNWLIFKRSLLHIFSLNYYLVETWSESTVCSKTCSCHVFSSTGKMGGGSLPSRRGASTAACESPAQPSACPPAASSGSPLAWDGHSGGYPGQKKDHPVMRIRGQPLEPELVGSKETERF